MPRTPEAHRAHARVAYALKTGKLVKPDHCQNPACGATDVPLEASHSDYRQPLLVKWLCVSCHRKADQANPKGGTLQSRGAETMEFVNRIIELKLVPACEIVGAPFNWRTHPTDQRAAVAASLEELGFYDPLLVYINAAGQYELIDGHLRQDLINAKVGPETMVPIIVTDLTEDEAKKANITHDPLAALAGTDHAKFNELLSQISTGSEPLQKMLAELHQEGIEQTLAEIAASGDTAEEPEPDDPAAEPAETYKTFSVPLTVAQESQVRGALRKAKQHFGTESSGEALASILKAWSDGQNQ